MERVLDHLAESLEPFDEFQVARAINFFANYDDLCHHAKEEEVLFPELLARAQDIMAGSIQVMKKEHTLARSYLAKAQEVFSEAVAQDVRSMQVLLRCLRSFVALEREHLRKEEIAIYGLSEQLLPPSMDEPMLLRFAELTANTIDAQAKALYEEFGLRPPTRSMASVSDRSPTRSPTRPRAGHPTPLAMARLAQPLDARSLAPLGAIPRADQTILSARRNRVLFAGEQHRALLLHDFGRATAVQANQYLIIDHDEGIVLDPGGPKVYPAILAETLSELEQGTLRYVFFSHQDPDVCTSMNAWMMDTRADAYVSQLWTRFLTHFGVDELLEHRLKAVPDEGLWLPLGESELAILPAHFLHSAGNLQVYDPVSKILFTGDLGASMGAEYARVTDFGTHLLYMKTFHERYMASNAALKRWVAMVRGLDIEVIAPQHGPAFEGRPMVEEFIAWCDALHCGVDLMTPTVELPPRTEDERRERARQRRSITRTGRGDTVPDTAPWPPTSFH